MGVINVLHLVGYLAPGGAEKMAVLTANELTKRDGMRVHFCYIRELHLDLLGALHKDINVFSLGRKGRFDVDAILRLRRKVRDLSIDIIHAHNTTVYIALAASVNTKAKVVWHDNLGETDTQLHLRKAIFYRLVFNKLAGYIGVNDKLVNWASTFGSKTNIRYIANFSKNLNQDDELPFKLRGNRLNSIVKLAHFRRQKNHPNFIHALGIVKRQGLEFYAYLAGGLYDQEYLAEVTALIKANDLEENVIIAGLVKNTGALLSACSIGVLSSDSEGLPLALIEYGLNNLAPVSTQVGQCEEVLGHGSYGALVPPGDSERLAEAIASLLKHPESLEGKGKAFGSFINEKYGEKSALNPICEMYELIQSGR